MKLKIKNNFEKSLKLDSVLFYDCLMIFMNRSCGFSQVCILVQLAPIEADFSPAMQRDAGGDMERGTGMD